VKNTLDEWIALHEQEFIQDITALVEIPSVSVKGGSTPCGEECFRALEKMLELGKNYGLETEMIGGRCGRISLGEAEREIGIWNHLDIVPAGEGWTYPPFEGAGDAGKSTVQPDTRLRRGMRNGGCRLVCNTAQSSGLVLCGRLRLPGMLRGEGHLPDCPQNGKNNGENKGHIRRNGSEQCACPCGGSAGA